VVATAGGGNEHGAAHGRLSAESPQCPKSLVMITEGTNRQIPEPSGGMV